MIRQAFKRLWGDKRGNMLVIAGAAMPLLVGSAGLATDTIQWTLWKRQLQRAADSAALAGVYQRIQGGDQAAVGSAVTRDLAINNHTGITLMSGYPEVTLPADSGTSRQQVNVVLKLSQSLPFSAMFMAAAPIITTTARAASVPGSDEYCVVSLEPNASKTGITVGGNASIEMDCGMISNSPAFNSALSNGNSSNVRASVIAAVGGVQASTRWNVDKYDPYVSAFEDPYADVNIDRTQMDCFSAGSKFPKLGTSTSSNFNGANATVTLADAQTANPGANCFSGLSVGSGTTLNLPAGTYYIGEGGADIQGTITGADVTLVMTRIDETAAVGTLSVNASANLSLTAPSAVTDPTNPYAGIAIYQDRNAVDSNSTQNKINGNSTSQIIGAVYFPNQEIVYNGGGSTGFVCTRLVGRRVVFSGNTAISNKFEMGSECPIFGDGGLEGGRRVRLVA